MRFASITPKEPTQIVARAPATEVMRRLVGAPLKQPPPAPLKSQDLPCDLDQRVRLVGEW